MLNPCQDQSLHIYETKISKNHYNQHQINNIDTFQLLLYFYVNKRYIYIYMCVPHSLFSKMSSYNDINDYFHIKYMS